MLADNASQRKQIPDEEPEMRKIRNPQQVATNPGLLFARGVEQLVSDQLYRPSSNDEQQRRREAPQAESKERLGEGNFFSAFLRQFVF